MTNLALSLLIVAYTASAQAPGPAPDKSRERKKPIPSSATSGYVGAKAPTPAPTDCTGRPTVNPDGTIATVLPDGRTKLTRPGVCGWTYIMPDGRRSAVSCQQVQVQLPAWPADDTSRLWLEAHSKNLLDVIGTLLGGDQASMDNYRQNYEKPDMSTYELIVVRTDTIAKLLKPAQ